MKKTISLLAAVLLLALSLDAQAIDPGFQVRITAPASITDLLELPDGRILVAGNFSFFNDEVHRRLVLIDAEGAVDPGFNPSFSDTIVTCLAYTGNGRFLVGGYFLDEEDEERGVLLALDAAGDLVAGFSEAIYDDRVLDVAALPDGRIVAAGLFGEIGATPAEGAALLSEAGVLLQPVDLGVDGDNPFFYRVLPIPEGGFYLAGNRRYEALFHRFTGDALPDTSFRFDFQLADGDFMIGIPFAERLPNGHLVFPAYTWEFRPKLVESDATGARVAAWNIPNPYGFGYTEATGPLLSCSVGGKQDLFAVDTTGSLRPLLPGEGDIDRVQEILPLANGGLLLGGSFTRVKNADRTGLARLTAAGQLDETYQPVVEQPATVLELVLTEQGAILVGGNFTRVNGQARPNLARLLPSGVLDEAFQPGGLDPGEPVNGLLARPDGGLWAFSSVGLFTPDPVFPVVRLQADGTPDPAFQPPGFQQMVGTVLGGHELPGGGVLAYGNFTFRTTERTFEYFLPLDENGGLLDDFGADLISGRLFAMAPDGSGGWYIGGENLQWTDGATGPLFRLTADGARDPAFQAPLAGNTVIRSLAPLAGGQVLAGGRIVTAEGAFREVVRLTAGGAVDPDFSWSYSGDKAPETGPRGISILADGSLLLSNTEAMDSTDFVHLENDGRLREAFSLDFGVSVNAILALTDTEWLLGGDFFVPGGGSSLLRYDAEAIISADRSPYVAGFGLRIYPQPFSDQFWLSIDGELPASTACRVRLLDPVGRLVRQWTWDGSPRQIAAGHLPSGVYWLVVDAGGRSVGKMVIRK